MARVSMFVGSLCFLVLVHVAFVSGLDLEEKLHYCPGKTGLCPDTATCCKAKTGGYGCCNLVNATCCHDGVHCCAGHSFCLWGHCFFAEEKKTVDVGVGTNCPGGGVCPGTSTCCVIVPELIGCCPYTNGVCCPDGLHCCPQGYTCDAGSATCSRVSGESVESAYFKSLIRGSDQAPSTTFAIRREKATTMAPEP